MSYTPVTLAAWSTSSSHARSAGCATDTKMQPTPSASCRATVNCAVMRRSASLSSGPRRCSVIHIRLSCAHASSVHTNTPVVLTSRTSFSRTAEPSHQYAAKSSVGRLSARSLSACISRSSQRDFIFIPSTSRLPCSHLAMPKSIPLWQTHLRGPATGILPGLVRFHRVRLLLKLQRRCAPSLGKTDAASSRVAARTPPSDAHRHQHIPRPVLRIRILRPHLPRALRVLELQPHFAFVPQRLQKF